MMMIRTNKFLRLTLVEYKIILSFEEKEERQILF